MILTRSGRTPSRPVALVGLAVAGLLLSGCGGSVGIHPGSAAVVGDASVSLSKIDDTARLYCEAYLPTIQQRSLHVPMRLLRQFVASSLAQRLLGEQLAAQYAVQPAPQYASHLSQVEQQFASAAPSVKAAAIDVEGGSAFLQTIQISLGQKLLSASGQSTGNVKAELQRGQVATQDWLKTHDVRVDPVLGISVSNGQFKAGADQTSYPVSPLATEAADESKLSASKSYAGHVSSSQVCG